VTVFKSLFDNRWLQRLVLAILRWLWPIARIGKNVVVTRHDAVTTALERPNDFSVVPVYEEKMRRTSGDFYLGMDDTARYHREREFTNRALAAMDLDWYRELARRFTREALGEVSTSGRLDVVQELSWLVPVRLCEEFFGVTGPDRRSLTRWVRYIFQHLFLNLGNDRVVAKRAENLAREMRAHVHGLITQCREELVRGSDRRDFLSQLVRLAGESDPAVDDDLILRNVGGVILGSVDTVSRAVINALQELLARPSELDAAQRAARSSDVDATSRYVFEALRFNPHNPLVVRYAAQDTTLETAGRGKVRVPKGSRVFALTYAAMFDPKHYERPNAFRTDRKGRSHLQFGFGLHRCFGERVALIAIEEMTQAVLALEHLARAPGEAGELILDGPFPDHFRVTFAARAALAPS
jgi:cytochrome P450